MTALLLSAWVLFPLTLLALCAGTGLLVRRLSGGGLSGVLLLPVGFALVVAVSASATSSPPLAKGSGPFLVILAVTGVVLESRHLRRPRRWLAAATFWPALAALVGFGAVAAAVVLTGTPTWTGFARIVDIAFQMGFAQHLAEAGRSIPPATSSFNETMIGLNANGYPGGAQATLGVVARLIHTDVAWCYQPYQAWAAAMGALSVFGLLRQAVDHRPLCCVGAAVAIQANILYSYGLGGGIKELTTATLIMLVAAVLAEWLTQRGRWRSLLCVAPPIAAALAAFSFGVVPWLGLLIPAAVVISLLRSGQRLSAIASWILACLATVVLAVPTLISSAHLVGTVRSAASGNLDIGLGNLTAPVPEVSAVGIWLNGDYRFPLMAHAELSHALDLLVIALAIVGCLFALRRRRRWFIAAFAVSAPIALAYVVDRTGPWVQLKAYTITAPMFLTMAFVGAGSLITWRNAPFARPVRVLGWLSAAIIAGSVLYGNALTYHHASLAPAARYQELAQIGTQFAGQGSAFIPAFDEYSEYFLRRENAYDLVLPPGLQVRPGAVNLAPGHYAYGYDTNELATTFVDAWHLLILPKSPISSRPPSIFDLATQTANFEVWRRQRPPSGVIKHFPLSGLPSERTGRYCQGLQHDLRHAGPHSLIAYVPSSPRTTLLPTQTKHPSYWHALDPEQLRALGSGELDGSIRLPAAGNYDISMRGSVGRPLTLRLDDRVVGIVSYQERYPGQYLHLAQLYLASGRHRVRLTRPNGDLHPGNGDGLDILSGLIGPMIFSLQERGTRTLHIAPASQAARICSARVGYQWIEIVRPTAVPSAIGQSSPQG